tara:strand:+ start:1183 stop:1548 length:366 start_codon:yes stop_codon:yes gene_type:complete
MFNPVTALSGDVRVIPVIIPTDAAVPTAFADLGTSRLSRIVMPASWTTANLTVQTSYDGLTGNDLYDSSGDEYVITAAASRAIKVPLIDFISERFIKLRSGTTGSPVNQAADRTLYLICQL